MKIKTLLITGASLISLLLLIYMYVDRNNIDKINENSDIIINKIPVEKDNFVKSNDKILGNAKLDKSKDVPNEIHKLPKSTLIKKWDDGTRVYKVGNDQFTLTANGEILHLPGDL